MQGKVCLFPSPPAGARLARLTKLEKLARLARLGLRLPDNAI